MSYTGADIWCNISKEHDYIKQCVEVLHFAFNVDGYPSNPMKMKYVCLSGVERKVILEIRMYAPPAVGVRTNVYADDDITFTERTALLPIMQRLDQAGKQWRSLDLAEQLKKLPGLVKEKIDHLDAYWIQSRQ